MPTANNDIRVSERGREYLRLQLAPEVGPIRLRNLLTHFGSVDAVLQASVAELQRVDGIGPKVAKSVFEARTGDAADREIQRAGECGLRIFCWEDAGYPAALLRITDPPICLYVRGELQPADAVAVAVVGTRRCSHYGREQAVRFGRLLAGAGFTVVSGLARGIDGHAHRGALEAGGRTIAVLGQGLSSIYPPEHETLASEIEKSGVVLSELPVDLAPDAKNFPKRNRIIIGLSLGVLVIEAGERSGALITARLATEYNREVFALPGRVDQPEVAAGSNALIRDGKAKLVTRLEDILDELSEVGNIMRPSPSEPRAQTTGASPPCQAPARPFNLPDHERMVFEAIDAGAEESNLILVATALAAGRVTSALTSLELKGLIRRLPGDRFVRRGSD